VKGLMKTETSDKENVNLNRLITETLDLFRNEAERDQIEFNFVFDTDPVLVMGDKIQLQQVLMNFIRNATTAMEQNRQKQKKIEVTLKLTKDEAIVAVKDNGIGLDPAVKEKLFQPFVSTKKDGLGIGLTLCKSLIERHNGRIWAEDISEGGTMFAFSLPVT